MYYSHFDIHNFDTLKKQLFANHIQTIGAESWSTQKQLSSLVVIPGLEFAISQLFFKSRVSSFFSLAP